MSFELCFDRLIKTEAEYVNNPDDPGGETKWGISKRSYPHLNIASLTRDDARQIYLGDFWNRVNADRLPDSVAYQLFDFAVNSGIETAVRYLQRALRVADDGYWGPISQAAADGTSETDMILLLNAERLDFMRRLKNWPYASKGWAGRIAQNLRYGAEDS